MTQVRQNPVASTKTPPGEVCLRHGWYPAPYQASQLRAAAVSPNVPPAAARAGLERSERIRRICPQCGGARPTDSQWIADVRRRIPAGAPA
jgi:hypothetical protein